MKLLRFNHLVNESTPAPRTGLLLADDIIADLRVGYARYLTEKVKDSQARELAALRISPNIVSMITIGKPAFEAMDASAAYLADLLKADPAAKGPIGEPLFLRLPECKLHAPIRPTKMIIFVAPPKGSSLPSIQIKANNTINSPFRDIVVPQRDSQLQCETKLAVIMGKRCGHLKESDAFDAVFGYMLGNDVSLRGDAPQNMHDTFLPTGPWVITRNEVKDPMSLDIRAWVNEKQQRAGKLSEMPFSIAQLIAHASSIMKLEPGDILLVGTPKGGTDAAAVALQLGDVLDTEIAGVGSLRNHVGDDPAR